MSILVTGANGMVGRALCHKLRQANQPVVAVVRDATQDGQVAVGAIHAATDWAPALKAHKVERVVHCAAAIPLSDAQEQCDSALLDEVNHLATLHLAQQCATAGVKRFVFLSTAKVYGEGQDLPYTQESKPSPQGAYALSKWRAEQALQCLADASAMEIVILRPPLVYGEGVKGNFLRLMQAIQSRRPLPLGAIHNRRSLIGLDNLVDAIACCLTHPDAAGQVFAVSDNQDVSTTELLRSLATAMGRTPLLLPIPAAALRLAGTALGKQAAMQRLLGSFALDSSAIQAQLLWQPPHSLHQGLDKTAQWFKQSIT
jgi:nucleoside-diphosphate-sugar epimerase